MAKAKKLPSGQWRTLVYDYTDAEKKRHYESFTADSRKESEYLAAEFALKKTECKKPHNYTVNQAIDEYIKNSDAVLSPTTIQGYKTIQKNSFQDLMDVPLKKLSSELLQSSVNKESKRLVSRHTKTKKTISPKTVKNSYGLLTAVINRYHPQMDCSVKLPALENTVKELIPPEIIFDIVKNTPIELPVILAMWLSFSMSEIKGLKKSTSIRDGYLSVQEVQVNVNGKPVTKKQAKAFSRTRRLKIPVYIQSLIDNTETDELVVLSSHAVYARFVRLIEKNNLPHMTFHDLRHINASVMAMLRIPDKYAMERGGWKTDSVMKKVYTHTFSEQREEVDTVIDSYFIKKCNTKCNTH